MGWSKQRAGTYGPGDGEGGACWDDLAAAGEGDGVSAGVATAGDDDGGRGEAGEGRGEGDEGEMHYGSWLDYFEIMARVS